MAITLKVANINVGHSVLVNCQNHFDTLGFLLITVIYILTSCEHTLNPHGLIKFLPVGRIGQLLTHN